MKGTRIFSLFLALLFMISIGATVVYQWIPATSIDSNLKELDQYLIEQDFHGVFLVGYQGDVIFEKSYGYQDKENDIKNSIDTAFLTGSLTKQFTAAAILQLHEQGKLELTDTINKYYPDYPNGHNITIHQLLTLTSGLPEYLDIFEKDALVGKEYSVEQVIDEVQKMEPRHSPGEVFEYNNTNYFMLAGMIEKVSGESYEKYIQKHLFERAGMEHSAYGFDSSKQENRAVGYMNDNYDVALFVHPSLSFGGGALSSTAHDLFLWDRALREEKILTNNSKNFMFSSHTPKSLMPKSYGYGQYVIEDGKKMFHPGFIKGFSSNMYRDIEKDVVVIALSNKDSDFLPMVPAFLHDFSERLEHSYIGYGVLASLYITLAFITFVLYKWFSYLYQRKLTFRSAKWYRIVFQTCILQALGFILLVVPFIPTFSHELFSSYQLLLIVAPFWGTIVNLIILLFVLATLGAIQPFIKIERQEMGTVSLIP